jgi:DNA polymerase (family 10)
MSIKDLFNRSSQIVVSSSLSSLAEGIESAEYMTEYAKEQGVPVCINPDAHDTDGLRNFWFGVQVARKGWLSAEDVLNTRSGAQMESLFGL